MDHPTNIVKACLVPFDSIVKTMRVPLNQRDEFKKELKTWMLQMLRNKRKHPEPSPRVSRYMKIYVKRALEFYKEHGSHATNQIGGLGFLMMALVSMLMLAPAVAPPALFATKVFIDKKLDNWTSSQENDNMHQQRNRNRNEYAEMEPVDKMEAQSSSARKQQQKPIQAPHNVALPPNSQTGPISEDLAESMEIVKSYMMGNGYPIHMIENNDLLKDLAVLYQHRVEECDEPALQKFSIRDILVDMGLLPEDQFNQLIITFGALVNHDVSSFELKNLRSDWSTRIQYIILGLNDSRKRFSEDIKIQFCKPLPHLPVLDDMLLHHLEYAAGLEKVTVDDIKKLHGNKMYKEIIGIVNKKVFAAAIPKTLQWLQATGFLSMKSTPTPISKMPKTHRQSPMVSERYMSPLIRKMIEDEKREKKANLLAEQEAALKSQDVNQNEQHGHMMNVLAAQQLQQKQKGGTIGALLALAPISTLITAVLFYMYESSKPRKNVAKV